MIYDDINSDADIANQSPYARAATSSSVSIPHTSSSSGEICDSFCSMSVYLTGNQIDVGFYLELGFVKNINFFVDTYCKI